MSNSTIGYYNRARELITSGKAKSEREAARMLAKETGKNEDTIRKRIQREAKREGTKNVPTPVPMDMSPSVPTPVPNSVPTPVPTPVPTLTRLEKLLIAKLVVQDLGRVLSIILDSDQEHQSALLDLLEIIRSKPQDRLDEAIEILKAKCR